MADPKNPSDGDVVFEEDFKHYLKRARRSSSMPSSLLDKLRHDTPIHTGGLSETQTQQGLIEDVGARVIRPVPTPDVVPARVGWSAASLEGQLLQGRYRVLSRVAKGGMSWVYRGEHAALRQPVAIKLLFPELVEEPDIRGRFLDEAQILYGLRHPHIVEVKDIIEEPDLLGMVLEWVEGEDLGDWLNRQNGPLTVGQMRALLLPVLDALATIHEQGMVHRDMKPENILLQCLPDDRFLPKITDFGLVKWSTEMQRIRTRTGSSMGTPHYMAPEQIRDSKSVDARSDVYSMGVILFEALAGQTPFIGEPQWVMVQKMQEPAPSLHQFCEGLSPALETLVTRCLSREPEKRFADGAALKTALTQALDEPMQITLRTTPEPLPSVGWRAWWPFRQSGTWMTVLIILVATCAFWFLSAQPPERSRQKLVRHHSVVPRPERGTADPVDNAVSPRVPTRFSPSSLALPRETRSLRPRSVKQSVSILKRRSLRSRKRKRVCVRFRSKHKGLTLWSRGRRLGQAPLRLCRLSGSEILLRFRCCGLRSWTQKFRFDSGQSFTIVRPPRNHLGTQSKTQPPVTKKPERRKPTDRDLDVMHSPFETR